MDKPLFYLLLIMLIAGCKSSNDELSTSTFEIKPASQVEWEKLNPLRGDQSPQAGTLWGDRKNNQVPTGFLAKFVDGFSSPPHIHNATYRAVVINGLIHNDDPSAAKMWMPTGSFWTQPKGEIHITSAKGNDCIALVEIDKGPYLVLPKKENFVSGESPINIVPGNIFWLDAKVSKENKVEIAYLWGKIEKENGTFIKLPAGFSGQINSTSPVFRAVVITGAANHKKSTEQLLPGSYFGSTGSFTHNISTSEETIIYIRTKGEYTLKSSK